MGSSEHVGAAVVESTWTRWKRRTITIPTTFVLTIIYSILLPILLPLLVVVDLVRRRRFGFTRTALFFFSFLWCEAVGILAAVCLWIAFLGRTSRSSVSFVQANSRFQAIWVQAIFSSARALFGMRLSVEGSAPPRGHRPLLVFLRHASTVDTGLPIVLLSYPLRYQLRYVLKRELLFDPCVDIVGQRIPNRFVRRGDRSGDEVERVLGLYQDLTPNDAVIIFPEGTRFSPRKREELLTQLRKRGPSPALDLAESLQHTLSPLRKGALALLEKNPGCDLVLIAHRGLERATSFAAFTQGTLVGANLEVRISHLPFDSLPEQPAAQEALLAQLWREVDDFAAGKSAVHKGQDNTP